MRCNLLVCALLALVTLLCVPPCAASARSVTRAAGVLHGLTSSRMGTSAGIGSDSDSNTDDDSVMANKNAASAALSNAASTANAKLPDLNYNTAISKIQLASHESAIIACIGIAVGALLCFAGQAYFKVFLGLVGMCFGGLIGLRLLGLIAYFDVLPRSNAKLYAYGFVIAVGLMGASLCLCLWSVGVFVAAATAGYFGTSVIISFPVIDNVAHAVNRHTLLAIGVVGALALAYFFNTLVVAVASSVIGAFMLTVGMDIFLKTGFNQDVYNMAVEQHPAIPTEQNPAFGMYALFAGLVVAGVVCQILFMRQRRKD